jgi:hypothetical protein
LAIGVGLAEILLAGAGLMLPGSNSSKKSVVDRYYACLPEKFIGVLKL